MEEEFRESDKLIIEAWIKNINLKILSAICVLLALW